MLRGKTSLKIQEEMDLMLLFILLLYFCFILNSYVGGSNALHG